MKTIKDIKVNKLNSEPWIIWGAAALFVLFVFFLQPAISIMIIPIKETFHLTDVGIGFLSSSFFYTYVIMQIPIGVLIDKIGVRRVLAMSIVGTFFSCIFFAYSDSYSMALVSRIVMGFFSAAAFPCAFCLGAEWFPSKMFPTVVGFTEMLGLVGGACAAFILSASVVMYGWRNTSMLTACFAATVGFIAIYCVKDSIENKITNFEAGGSQSFDDDSVIIDTADHTVEENDYKTLIDAQHNAATIPEEKNVTEEVTKEIGNKFLFVISHSQVWFLSLYSGMLFAVIGAFILLWGIPFLMAKYSITLESAANSMVLAFIGAAIGTPVMAWCGHRSRKKKTLMFIGSALTFLMLVILFYLPIPISLSYLFLFLLGLSCTVYIIPFSIVKTLFPKEVCGTAMAFTNAICGIGTLFLQPLIGWISHILSAGKITGLDSFYYSLALIPICVIFSFVFLWKIRID